MRERVAEPENDQFGMRMTALDPYGIECPSASDAGRTAHETLAALMRPLEDGSRTAGAF